ncbi:alpha/beta fold hydrolase [Streptomyces spectabilis]|uniref:Alpha/beta hydrolase n=1 Tax=Streptomyces spectabilis TaxID=68270 RepID=A0A5P2WZQ5_STRST|nr:alpha/beta hydrolase [Streptomyces spectabilis]MBB5101534.1 pimeloyl-ACP methyl ester carboxylesterase [Streptomyces spectabilis]MCI3900723.1 alpha/beta hydrolase [Streptomyces spectabilis]QEV58263.1 alpha/beta hydrolase [Streptomyces spectabilis]GGV11997.1 alpha/beta hydrolase [Streptomyces spectabilis]
MSTEKHTARAASIAGTATAARVTSLASLASAPAVAPDQEAAARPTVVLVHGAFADASGWMETAARLRHQGFGVEAVANPLRGLDYDTAYLKGMLQGIEGAKILVGHSYGGAVITNAAADVPGVKALVYVAAFAPDEGETLGGLLEQHPDPGVPPLPQRAVQFTRPDGSTGTEVMLDPAEFADAFAADVPAKTAALMAASQRPIAVEAFGQPARQAAWKTIPSWALVATKDHAIAPSLERFMAKRADARITEVNSSHAVMVSHPNVVSDVINRAYHATR